MTDLNNVACGRLLQLAIHRPRAVGPFLLDRDPDRLFHDRALSDAMARLLGGWTAQRAADASTHPEIKRRLPWMAALPWCGVHKAGQACDCEPDPEEIRELVEHVAAWFVAIEEEAR